MSVTVILEFKVKPELVGQVKENTIQALNDTRAFAGCEGLELIINKDDPANFVVYEKWDSKASYEKYFAWRVESGFLDEMGKAFAAEPSIRYFDTLREY